MSTDFVKVQAEVMNGMQALGQGLPDVMGSFSKLHAAAVRPGALTSATKELMALAIAIAIRCEGCIACHVKDALEFGATPEEIEETIGVAILMGGGPAVVYGAEAREALEQFRAQGGEQGGEQQA